MLKGTLVRFGTEVLDYYRLLFCFHEVSRRTVFDAKVGCCNVLRRQILIMVAEFKRVIGLTCNSVDRITFV